MSEQVLTAIIAAAAVVAVAMIGGIGAHIARLSTRVRQLERRERLSWLYIRSLIDHSYRAGALPLPEPPEGWDDDQ